jgi:hypothetical protein
LLGDGFSGKTVLDVNRDAAFALLSLSHEPIASTTNPIECEGSSIYFKMDDKNNMILNLPTIVDEGNQEFMSGEYFSHITVETTSHFA